MVLRCGAPASNKPHSAEKRTPVWLAIWHIWAGFANSQLRCATSCSTYLYMCPSPLLPSWTAAQTDANLSVHLRRLPTPPPYLRQMRLSPGRGRRYRVQDMAAALPGAGVWCWIWLPLGRRGGDGWQIMLLVVRVAVPANHRARFKNVIYL